MNAKILWTLRHHLEFIFKFINEEIFKSVRGLNKKQGKVRNLLLMQTMRIILKNEKIGLLEASKT